jgi:hypothetical protein
MKNKIQFQKKKKKNLHYTSLPTLPLPYYLHPVQMNHTGTVLHVGHVTQGLVDLVPSGPGAPFPLIDSLRVSSALSTLRPFSGGKGSQSLGVLSGRISALAGRAAREWEERVGAVVLGAAIAEDALAGSAALASAGQVPLGGGGVIEASVVAGWMTVAADLAGAKDSLAPEEGKALARKAFAKLVRAAAATPDLRRDGPMAAAVKRFFSEGLRGSTPASLAAGAPETAAVVVAVGTMAKPQAERLDDAYLRAALDCPTEAGARDAIAVLVALREHSLPPEAWTSFLERLVAGFAHVGAMITAGLDPTAAGSGAQGKQQQQQGLHTLHPGSSGLDSAGFPLPGPIQTGGAGIGAADKVFQPDAAGGSAAEPFPGESLAERLARHAERLSLAIELLLACPRSAQVSTAPSQVCAAAIRALELGGPGRRPTTSTVNEHLSARDVLFALPHLHAAACVVLSAAVARFRLRLLPHAAAVSRAALAGARRATDARLAGANEMLRTAAYRCVARVVEHFGGSAAEALVLPSLPHLISEVQPGYVEAHAASSSVGSADLGGGGSSLMSPLSPNPGSAGAGHHGHHGHHGHQGGIMGSPAFASGGSSGISGSAVVVTPNSKKAPRAREATMTTGLGVRARNVALNRCSAAALRALLAAARHANHGLPAAVREELASLYVDWCHAALFADEPVPPTSAECFTLLVSLVSACAHSSHPRHSVHVGRIVALLDRATNHGCEAVASEARAASVYLASLTYPVGPPEKATLDIVEQHHQAPASLATLARDELPGADTALAQRKGNNNDEGTAGQDKKSEQRGATGAAANVPAAPLPTATSNKSASAPISDFAGGKSTSMAGVFGAAAAPAPAPAPAAKAAEAATRKRGASPAAPDNHTPAEAPLKKTKPDAIAAVNATTPSAATPVAAPAKPAAPPAAPIAAADDDLELPDIVSSDDDGSD